MDSSMPTGGPNKTVIIAIAGGALLMVIVLAVAVLSSRGTQQTGAPPTGAPQGQGQAPTGSGPRDTNEDSRTPPPAPGVVAVVGEEFVYQTDLNRVLDLYPPGLRQSNREDALNRVIRESVALQSGAREGWVTLDDLIFNSSSKDQAARAQAVAAVENAVNARTGKLSGAVVSIWFFNNGAPGSAGYEGGKRIAKQKIDAARAAVASGEKSVVQVAREIKDDTSLAALDPVWVQNAIATFEDVGPDESITFDPAFNKTIRSLRPGQVSPVSLISVKSGNGMREAVYMFAQVTENTPGESTAGGYEEWLDIETKTYAIERF